MQSIETLIHQATEAPVGVVVHVGAGRGAVLEQYARLGPSTVVLLEGDPDTAHALQRAARPFPWARVVARAAAATDGELTWNRYNLPSLNGPVSVETLACTYPRLNLEAATSVSGVALSSVLRSALEGRDADRTAVLVLDVPGQEAALLDSIGAELHRLSGVVVRRCATTLPGAAPWSVVLGRMRAQSFELVGHEADGEPLWPVAYFRFDQRRHEEMLLKSEIEALRSQLAAVEAEFAGAREAAQSVVNEQARQVEALAHTKAAAETVAAEREAAIVQLTKVRDEQARQIEALTQANAAAEKLAAERGAESQQLAQARDEQARQIEALTQANAAAEKLAAERGAESQQLAQARDEQARQIEALTQAKAAAEKLAAERGAESQQLAQARDEQALQIEALTQAKAAAEKFAAERGAESQQLAQARDEQARQIEALTQAKAAAEKLAAERGAESQRLAQARDEQARQIEALTQAKAAAETVAAEREASVRHLQNDLRQQELAHRQVLESTSALEGRLVALKIELDQVAEREGSLRVLREVEYAELSSLRRANAVLQNNLADLQDQYRALWSSAGTARLKEADGHYRMTAGVAASTAANGAARRRRRRKLSRVIAPNPAPVVTMPNQGSASSGGDRFLTQIATTNRTDLV